MTDHTEQRERELVARLERERDETLLEIIRRIGVYNEAGQRIPSFQNLNRDALDFCIVSKEHLRGLMIAAYEAGRKQQ